jgi:hypothetical protein
LYYDLYGISYWGGTTGDGLISGLIVRVNVAVIAGCRGVIANVIGTLIGIGDVLDGISTLGTGTVIAIAFTPVVNASILRARGPLFSRRTLPKILLYRNPNRGFVLTVLYNTVENRNGAFETAGLLSELSGRSSGVSL